MLTSIDSRAPTRRTRQDDAPARVERARCLRVLWIKQNLILRCGILRPIGNFPESLSQGIGILVGRFLVGRLGVMPRRPRGSRGRARQPLGASSNFNIVDYISAISIQHIIIVWKVDYLFNITSGGRGVPGCLGAPPHRPAPLRQPPRQASLLLLLLLLLRALLLLLLIIIIIMMMMIIVIIIIIIIIHIKWQQTNVLTCYYYYYY